MSSDSTFDAYHKWLGIPPQRQPPTYYLLLGLQNFESDPDVIEAAATRQMSHLQTYKLGPHSARSQELLNEIARAKLCLLTKAEKDKYDLQLSARLAKGTLPEAARSNATPIRPTPLRGRKVLAPTVIALSLALVMSALVLYGVSRFLTGTTPVVAPVLRSKVDSQPGQRPIGSNAVRSPVAPPKAGLPQKLTIVPGSSPNEAAAFAESRKTISAPAVRENDRWINVTYNAIVVRTENGKWEEQDSKSGRLINSLDEVGHSDQYIEVSNPAKNHHLRLFGNRMEQKLNGKWNWVASGYWETEGLRAEAEARNLSEKDTSNDSGLPTRWINETYNSAIYHVQGKQWAEADNKTGQISSYLIKTSRTGEYLELFHVNLKQTYRVSRRRLEARDGNKWKWIADGRWQ